MEEIADIFYRVILPPFLVFFFGYWMYVLQKRSTGSTAQDLKLLIDEIQEERNRMAETIKEYESERKLLIEGVANCGSQIQAMEEERKAAWESYQKDRQQWLKEKAAMEATISNLRDEILRLRKQLEGVQNTVKKNTDRLSKDKLRK